MQRNIIHLKKAKKDIHFYIMPSCRGFST